jgi:phage RecT family recombinase
MAPFMSILDKAKGMLQEVAHKTIVQPDRLIYIARAGLSRSPALLECTPLSWVGALMDCAQLGLEPIGALGHFYFIPYRNNDNGTMEVNGQLGYLGITELARRGEGPDKILWVKSEAVFDGDELIVEEGAGFDGTNKVANYFRHRPNYGKRTEAIVAAWALAHFKDGSDVFRVIDKGELKKAKDASKAGRKNKGPWRDWAPQMSAKTAVRRMRTVLPQTTVLAKALAVDETVELGLPGGRWRELGDHGEKIDMAMEDLAKGKELGKSSQVPRGELETKATVIEEEPPPPEEPPPGMEVEPSKSKKESKKLSPANLVKGFAKWGVKQEDIERSIAGEDEPPLPMDEWEEGHLSRLDAVLTLARAAKSADRAKELLRKEFKLEPGALE